MKLIIKLNRYLYKFFNIVDKSPITHKFILYIILKSSFIYWYLRFIILFRYKGVVLKGYSIVRYWFGLTQFLNDSFGDKFFIGWSEYLLNAFLK